MYTGSHQARVRPLARAAQHGTVGTRDVSGVCTALRAMRSTTHATVHESHPWLQRFRSRAVLSSRAIDFDAIAMRAPRIIALQRTIVVLPEVVCRPQIGIADRARLAAVLAIAR